MQGLDTDTLSVWAISLIDDCCRSHASWSDWLKMVAIDKKLSYSQRRDA